MEKNNLPEVVDTYTNLNYHLLEGKFVDARELISYLVGSIRQYGSDDIQSACYECVISFVFSHLKSV